MAAVVYEFNAAVSAPPRGIRVVVCDPNPEVRGRVRSAIHADPGLWLMSAACNWEECENDLESLLPELLIVRANLIPFGWAPSIEPGELFPVVITLGAAGCGNTAAAYSVWSLPVEMEAAKVSLTRAATEIYNRKAKQLSDLLARYITGLGKTKKYPSTITVEQGRHPIELSTDAIRTIVAARKYVWIDSVSGRYLARRPIHQMAAELDPEKFVRIHRSIIVNLQYVDMPVSIDHRLSHVVLLDGSKHPIGINYRESVAPMFTSGQRE